MDSTPHLANAKNLQTLVADSVPRSTPDHQVQRLANYCQRILSSKMSAPTSRADDDHIRQLLTKKVTAKKQTSNSRWSKNQELQEFESLMSKFRQNCVYLTKKPEVLYLLLQMAGQGRVQQVPAIESVFAQKAIKPVDYVPLRKQQKDEEMRDVQGMPNSTKQKQLAFLRNQNPNFVQFDESELVRELLFVFQGIDGQEIKYSILEDSYVLSANLIISPSTRKIVNELSELGWLYKKINDWLARNIENSQYCNQVTQSLCFAVQAELTEYFRLIAILDSQRSKYGPEEPANYLNLKKLYLWVQEPLERLKWLAIIIDAVLNLKGGAVCSAINMYVFNGNPANREFVSRILKEVSQPVLTMIKTWMIEGEINDPFAEFFVEQDSSVPDERLWNDKYKMNIQMIPSFLTNSLAQKILLTGKAVNFIRRCCLEQDWILDASLQTPFEAQQLVGSHKDNFTYLQNWVDNLYEQTNKQLLRILFQKYKFLEHCEAIRRYLLMGQGDFITQLMDHLVEELSQNASTIYKHNLMSHLEQSVRSSNAQYHIPEYLNRLDIKLLESSAGEKGWEIFTLDYKISDLSPLQSIFTPQIMENYIQVFNFLWKLKKLDHELTNNWSENMSNRQIFSKIKGQGIQDNFHKFNLSRHEMIHFISNVHNYMMVEVLEASWTVFMEKVRIAKDFDQLIFEQRKFCETIMRKSLIAEKDMYDSLMRTVTHVSMFINIKKRLFKSAADEYQRQLTNEESKRLGSYVDDFDDETEISQQSIEQLKKIHLEFRRSFKHFREMLHNDKYFSLRLDFNKYYEQLSHQEEQRRRQGPGGIDNDMRILNVSDDDDDYDDEDYGGEDDDDSDIDDDRMGGPKRGGGTHLFDSSKGRHM